MRDGTDSAHLLRAYVRAWPRRIGGEADGAEFGFKWHTQSQRNGELDRFHGFKTVGGKPEGGNTWKYQLASQAVYFSAQLEMKSWETGDVYQSGLFGGGGA